MTACAEKTGRWAWRRPDGSLAPLRGDVRFQKVDFGYEAGQPILKGISLYAEPGQKIAFVGSTGAGKTTITNLINRFYEVQGGGVTYDGIDVRDIKKDSLRPVSYTHLGRFSAGPQGRGALCPPRRGLLPVYGGGDVPPAGVRASGRVKRLRNRGCLLYTSRCV